MITKKCSTCKFEKPSPCFYRDGGFLSSRCKPCSRAAASKWNKENPKRYKRKLDRWFKKNPEKRKAYTEKYKPRRKLFRKMIWDGYRKTVVEHYGNKCSCCGEAEFNFLSMDHINNDGAIHRRTLKTSSIYYWLIKNNYPSGFQVLCMNCNWGKHRNGGICPHQTK